MSIRIASILAWVLGILAFLTSLGRLPRFSGLTIAGRTTAVWLLCAGIALIAVGIGLRRNHRYARWTAVTVCGLWLTIQGTAVIRLLSAGATWSTTTWIIVATQSLFCLAIVIIVVRHGVGGRTLDNRASSSDAA